jgi:arsenite methyltransferase
MNAFLALLETHGESSADSGITRGKLTTLQVNLGNLCNQQCVHCHIDASPQGRKIMSRETVDAILLFLAGNKWLTLDITGGAPELNPEFDHLIRSARPMVSEIMVRSNLTVLFEPGKEHLPSFFREHNVHLICSLPCFTEQNVDLQRGTGVFEKSVRALRMLNDLGFAHEDQLPLDLVYNPNGASLPPRQEELESQYKHALSHDYGIDFNRLITITNVPIKRFRKHLESQGEYDRYMDLLRESFNPSVVENLMCRTFLSVGYDGKLHDCDFNQALDLALTDEDGAFLTIEEVVAHELEGREIALGEHCLACTAGYGSSCQGVLDTGRTVAASDLGVSIRTGGERESVKSYYGRLLKSKKDLRTSACCATDSLPTHHKSILSEIEPEILDKFYGCGSPIPPLLDGCVVLDLGCGTGRDVYLASRLAGPGGLVIGVDMTDEQLDVARRHVESQMARFEFPAPNVEFKKGYIEDLRELCIDDRSVDVVISNCVINLSPDKNAVFSEVFRVLKPGGELYFADIFTGRRMPESLRTDPVLYGECLGGALYIEDFRRMLRGVGCPDYRVFSKRRVALSDPEIEARAGMIDFYSMTIRAFKLDNLEDICEDYGQAAVYLGTIPDHPHQFALDDYHVFAAGKPALVCGNSAAMLEDTRYGGHFRIIGDRSTHYGPFDCTPTLTGTDNQDAVGDSCCA